MRRMVLAGEVVVSGSQSGTKLHKIVVKVVGVIVTKARGAKSVFERTRDKDKGKVRKVAAGHAVLLQAR